MKLRTKYILYVIFIHLVFVLLSYELWSRNRLYFFLGEILILVSVLISLRLYKVLIRPINLISSGIDILKERDFNTRLSATGQSEIDSLVEVYNRMNDELREERIKQVEQNYFLEKLIQASPSGIMLMDQDNKVASANPAALNMLGKKEESILGIRLNEIQSTLADELAVLEEGKARIINLNGSQIYRGYRSFFLDKGLQRHFYILEEMTKEVLKTERKAYEKVVRMMSHEINNSIGAVNSFLQSFINYKSQLKSGDQEDFEDSLNIAIERNTRLNSFMANLANVVKIPEPRKESVDLHALLKNAERLFMCECESRKITWQWSLDSATMKVCMDILQMEQVIYNIIRNAIEAIGKNGTITIETHNSNPPRLIIRDNGKGISRENKPLMFTPFFSTRPDGQGIGLTLTKEVLLNHNFNFSLDTPVKGCTEFKIEFNMDACVK